MIVEPKLLEILACPKCKGQLIVVEKPEGFGCPTCELLFANDDNIPNFLIDEATHWTSR